MTARTAFRISMALSVLSMALALLAMALTFGWLS